jgi:hypothetical protein
MRSPTKLDSPLIMLADTLQGPDRIVLETPDDFLVEVKKIVSLMFGRFEFDRIYQVFRDILKLFGGTYPGYSRCNTLYHDLNHTMDCFLVTAQIIHGAFIQGINFEEVDVNLGLIAALMHDTGYIQAVGDDQGSGGKYTLCHISRSIEFLEKYFQDNGFPREYVPICRNLLSCTGLDVKIAEIKFPSRRQKILGQILGTADLIGQMANANYPEKLHFLYGEFKEGGVPGFTDELDFLKQTPDFWEMVKQRFALELGQVDRYLGAHFRVRWEIDRDLYHQAIDRNMERVRAMTKSFEADYYRYRRPPDRFKPFLGSPI